MKEWLINTHFDFKKIPYLEKKTYSTITQLFENVLRNEHSFLFGNLAMNEVLLYREPENETSIEHIRNWFRYRIINLLLDGFIFDCESSKEAKELYLLLGWDHEQYFDNIHSFQSIWTMIIKKFGKQKISEYYIKDKNNYELLARTLLMKTGASLYSTKALATRLWQFNHIENFNIPIDILTELSKLAHNTHTIGNFMPCPGYHYNFVKGNFDNDCDDRMDLILSKLKNMSAPIFYQNFYHHQKKLLTKEESEMILQWFHQDRIDHYLLNSYLDNHGELVIHSITSFEKMSEFTKIQDICNYLRQINYLIETRSNQISEKLKLENHS